MLAVRCALLTALLAAPGAALVPGVCPALGKGLARTWWAEPTGGWGKTAVATADGAGERPEGGKEG